MVLGAQRDGCAMEGPRVAAGAILFEVSITGQTASPWELGLITPRSVGNAHRSKGYRRETPRQGWLWRLMLERMVTERAGWDGHRRALRCRWRTTR